jgi:hypothetical protein
MKTLFPTSEPGLGKKPRAILSALLLATALSACGGGGGGGGGGATPPTGDGDDGGGSDAPGGPIVPVTYTVTASAAAGGAISPEGHVPVMAGLTSSFTVTPSPGYRIAAVDGTCGGALSGNTYTTSAIIGDCTVTASFTRTPYTVTASAGTGGSISPSGTISVVSDATQTFTITPDAGYSIATVGGTCCGALDGNTYTTNTITGDCAVTASFTRNPYTVTASAGTGGSISPSGAVSVVAGSTQSFTITPDAGYSIAAVGGTCSGTLSGNTYTTHAITGDCAVAASFTPNPTYHAITADRKSTRLNSSHSTRSRMPSSA